MTRWLFLAGVALLVAANLWIVTEIHQARQHYEAVCRDTLAKELRLSPRARELLLPADPCEAIRTVRRGR